MPSANSHLHLVSEDAIARSVAGRKACENSAITTASSLLSPSRRDSTEEATNMAMPSLLIWVLGAAALVVLSGLLRYVANDAHELARSRGRASIAAELIGANKSRKAA